MSCTVPAPPRLNDAQIEQLKFEDFIAAFSAHGLLKSRVRHGARLERRSV